MNGPEWKNLNITHEELSRFSEAFKSEEFRKLFANYCKEITDPDNRQVYEEELKKLEAERGIEATFVRPKPGFVLRANTKEEQEVFINVAQSELVDKPTSECGEDASGQKGLHWKLPYIQSKLKRDLNGNKTICHIYDVIFHPDTLHLAEKNEMFKKLVIDTACDAIRSSFKVNLKKDCVECASIDYKGPAEPLLLRKKVGPSTVPEDDPLNHIYPPVLQNVAEKKSRSEASSKKNSKYKVPKYEIVHRHHIEMHEMTDEIDAKINATIPKELVIKIDLPLLQSAKNVSLDINTKSISLSSDTPAKYRLNIELPFEVKKDNGSAQFDSDTRKLIVTLPVMRRKEFTIADLCREDSGVESDHHSPKEDSSSGSSDDVFEDAVEVPLKFNKTNAANQNIATKPKQDDSSSLASTFLDPAVSYTLPHFTYNRFNNTVAFTLHVKNADPSSIALIHDTTSVQIKFISIGSGFFPVHYAFYFNTQEPEVTICDAPRIEAWDNNVVVQIDLNAADHFESYLAGLSSSDCKEFTDQHAAEKKLSKKFTELEVCQNNSADDIEVVTNVTCAEVKIEIKNKHFEPESKVNGSSQGNGMNRNTKKCLKKTNKKNRSFSESHCDHLKSEEQNNEEMYKRPVSEDNDQNSYSLKLRTQSESSNDEHHGESFVLKSILKRYSSYDRQTSECSDEHEYSRSMDLGIGSFTSIPEERDSELSESARKTVRFDKQLCRKLLFKMNSTIIGQRKPKENKRKKKKRCRDRRYSEGEASDYENNVSTTEHQFSDHGKKPTNPVDNKNGLMFDLEI